MGDSRHSGSARTSPGSSPPRAAPVMAELVSQAAALSLGSQQQQQQQQPQHLSSFAGGGGSGSFSSAYSNASHASAFGAGAFSVPPGMGFDAAGSPSRSIESGMDSRALEWDRHLAYHQFTTGGGGGSRTPSVASSFGSVNSSHNGSIFEGGGGSSNRNGLGNNGYSSGGYIGSYGALGSGYLADTYSLPSPPQQPPAEPPRLPPNTTSPFLQYNFQQPSVGFYTSQQGSVATPQTSTASTGGAGQSGGRQGGVWMPPDVSVNLNKAITKRLANATHYQQLLDIISDSALYFDEVNVATALHRLARLHCTSANSNAATVIVTSDQFRLLLAAIRKLLPRFEAQAVSNTAWALATLAYLPEGDLLQELAERATAIIRTFRPQATSNTLWAYAKLGVTPPESFMMAAAQQMLHDLSRSVPQDISNTLWAYATLRYSPGVALLNGAASHAVYCMPRFKPQEVANTLWSYATLGHDPGAPLLDAIAAHMCDRMHVFRPQAISNSLWAYAKLSYNPGRELLEAAGRRALAALHQYTPQELGNTLWAAAVLDHYPGAPLMDAASAHILRRLEHFGPADTSNSLWAYARLFHYPGPDLLQAVGLHAMRQWHRFRAAEVANLVWALAILKAPFTELWAGLLEKLAHAPVASFDDADLHQIFQAYLLLDPSIKQAGAVAPAGAFPHALLEEAESRWKASIRAPSAVPALLDSVSKMLWKMGISHTVHHLTSDGLFCVDIALDGEQVVLEVDSPSNFSINSHRPLGRTVGRRCMLEACGYTVRSILYYEWATFATEEVQRTYLTRLLASCL